MGGMNNKVDRGSNGRFQKKGTKEKTITINVPDENSYLSMGKVKKIDNEGKEYEENDFNHPKIIELFNILYTEICPMRTALESCMISQAIFTRWKEYAKKDIEENVEYSKYILLLQRIDKYMADMERILLKEMRENDCSREKIQANTWLLEHIRQDRYNLKFVGSSNDSAGTSAQNNKPSDIISQYSGKLVFVDASENADEEIAVLTKKYEERLNGKAS